jgi:hypothetical protein
MAITLDGTNGINSSGVIVAPDGSASAPAITNDGDTNTGIFFPAADTIAFAEGGAEAMRIDSSGNVGIGTTSPKLNGNGGTFLSVIGTNFNGWLELGTTSQTNDIGGAITFNNTNIAGSDKRVAQISSGRSGADNSAYLNFITWNAGTGAERARIDSSGNLLVGATSNAFFNKGVEAGNAGYLFVTRDGGTPLWVNRLTNDGVLVEFAQDSSLEGTISVSGSTVSYNGGHLSRWAQTTTAKDESLKKGTVMSNLDEMNVYIAPTTYWTEEDELPVDEEGNLTVAVGDLKQETSVSENEQLNKVKVSDVEGDANVAGVFVNWTYDEAHFVDEINMAMTGDMIIRIAEGVTVARGDLLMSAGDGTAKPQGDDIVRSKTIAKVTSTHVTCTYDDGSYCVPCVLMAC